MQYNLYLMTRPSIMPLMDRQLTLEHIHHHLQSANDAILQSILTLLSHTQPSLDLLDSPDAPDALDSWDKEMLADSQSAKFDDFIKRMWQEHDAGETLPLVC